METHGTNIIGHLSKEYSNALYQIYRHEKNVDLKKLYEIVENTPKEAIRFYEKMKQRKKRYRRRLNLMFEKNENLWFCTWTFSNEHINAAEKIFKKYRAILRSINCMFILNEDYGSDFGRLHYHGVTSVRPPKWEYGFFCFKKIKKNSISIYKISDYVNKLTNHGLKATNERAHVYYNVF